MTDSKYGKRNLYPILIRRSGITRVLDRSAALANSSPNGNFTIVSGIENLAGRDKTFPKVAVKSAFVIGFGDTAFTGPVIDLSAIAYRISPSKSSSPIQLIY